MTCNACGEKPKDTAKDFTKAVIEINNPETLVLLRKVVIPASMGTEEDVPAAIGKYHNVILHYEANKHTYLYSSDGIPTLLEMEVPQEVLDRISKLEEDLEQETVNREGMDEELQSNIDAVAQDLEDFKNSPDVVDIVPTYAALQAYDTSKLSDNDEVRVLADETRDGASSYYRWDKTNNQWIFIGVTGPYYTKSEIDTTVQSIEGDIDDAQSKIGDLSTLTTSVKSSTVAAINEINTAVQDIEGDVEEVQSKIGQAKVLTTEDYNWNSTTHSATEPYNCVALWLLDPGMYVVANDNEVVKYMKVSPYREVFGQAGDTYFVSAVGNYGTQILNLRASATTTSGYSPFEVYVCGSNDGWFDTNYYFNLYKTQNRLDSDSTVAPLSANKGRELNSKIGDISTLTTVTKISLVNAINELVARVSALEGN